MHFLFVIDPLPALKAWKDSSVAIMRSLAAQGHDFSFATMGDLYIQEGRVQVAGHGDALARRSPTGMAMTGGRRTPRRANARWPTSTAC